MPHNHRLYDTQLFIWRWNTILGNILLLPDCRMLSGLSKCRKNNRWEFTVPHELILVAQHSSARETLMHSSQRWLLKSFAHIWFMQQYTIVELQLLNVMHPKLACSLLANQVHSLREIHLHSHPLWNHVHPQFMHPYSYCHCGSLVLPLYTLLHHPSMDISFGKSNIRELIDWKQWVIRVLMTE